MTKFRFTMSQRTLHGSRTWKGEIEVDRTGAALTDAIASLAELHRRDERSGWPVLNDERSVTIRITRMVG